MNIKHKLSPLLLAASFSAILTMTAFAASPADSIFAPGLPAAETTPAANSTAVNANLESYRQLLQEAAAMGIDPATAAERVGLDVQTAAELMGMNVQVNAEGQSYITTSEGFQHVGTDPEIIRGYMTTPANGDMQPDSVLNLVPLCSYFTYNSDGKLQDQSTTAIQNSYSYSPAGFNRIKIEHANVGRWYYRTYSNTSGWGPWATSKETTPDEGLVSAIQIRTKGYTHNLGTVYYRAVLNDGTMTDWAREGQACGTIGNDRYIIALKIALWNNNTPFYDSTARPLVNTYTEGVVNVNGKVTYQTAEGAPYTGWGFDDQKQYYFVNGQAVTGWNEIDGYNIYFDENGVALQDLEPIMGKPGVYELRVNKATRTLHIMTKDGNGNFTIPYKTLMVTVGDDTPIGSFKTFEKIRWHFMHEDCYTQFLTRFKGHFLFHSLLYTRPDKNTMDAIYYNFMDDSMSGGCVRLRAVDCAWIHDNVPLQTPVTIYNNPWDKGPIEKDAIQQAIPRDQTWDPTDPVITAENAAAQEAAAKAAEEAIREAAQGIGEPQS